ncbi:hypothetical protein ASG35_11275 [Burkholderia sp. Leaf177]|nr:hypothetical protein ASG35_11275 [Burkholderia sp. Leaf177]
MVPDRVIPVIFVPGIMGTNLKSSESGDPVWLIDSALGLATDWAFAGAATRKTLLDPRLTEVFPEGKIYSGTGQTESELRWRGWGEVARSSYGKWLVWLENALNDVDSCKTGLRAQLLEKLISDENGPTLLKIEEVELSYMYQLPVHVVGYNWLQSNKASSERLASKIDEFVAKYCAQGKVCEKVILVTHSMGGLVARYYSEVLPNNKSNNQEDQVIAGCRDNVLGIVHGVMPATGSATAYKRVKAGTEGIAGYVLGADAAEITAVFAQAPGALQLLPSTEYGSGWLKIQDGESIQALPHSEPYTEIYIQEKKWWALVDESLINPLDPEKVFITKDWGKIVELIREEVYPFHNSIANAYHNQTFAFFGDDPKHATWGDVIWKRKARRFFESKASENTFPDLLQQPPGKGKGTGTYTIVDPYNKSSSTAKFVLQAPNENGDGTVPVRSGRSPFGKPGVQMCLAFSGVDHESAYKKETQKLFALWAITKLVDRVRGTSLEYQEC